MTDLHNLRREEKISLVQALWDDIAKEQSIEDLPESHQKILNERIQIIADSKAIYKPWSAVQKKFDI